ncbi:MAG: cephalosporin hydroxylase family protein [Pirellulaceae bacterium]
MKIRLDTDGYAKEVDIYSEEGTRLIADLWTKVFCEKRLMYEPTWLGVPIIQFPNDIVMMQELIWSLKPDVIVETGVAHGGSAIFYASLLELIGRGRVIGVEIEMREHNAIALMNHPLRHRITVVEGSSIQETTVAEVNGLLNPGDKVLVVLDSNHTYQHVIREMELYAPLVPVDGYMVVMDGVGDLVWDIPSGKAEWRGENPLKAIKEFIQKYPEWKVDSRYNRLMVTSSPLGFLKRTTGRPDK